MKEESDGKEGNGSDVKQCAHKGGKGSYNKGSEAGIEGKQTVVIPRVVMGGRQPRAVMEGRQH